MATMMQDEYLADAQNISRPAPAIRLKFEEHREYVVINNTLKHRKLIFKISSNNVINLKYTQIAIASGQLQYFVNRWSDLPLI